MEWVREILSSSSLLVYALVPSSLAKNDFMITVIKRRNWMFLMQSIVGWKSKSSQYKMLVQSTGRCLRRFATQTLCMRYKMVVESTEKCLRLEIRHQWCDRPAVNYWRRCKTANSSLLFFFCVHRVVRVGVCLISHTSKMVPRHFSLSMFSVFLNKKVAHNFVGYS